MNSFRTLLLEEVDRRLLGESIPRLEKCLQQLTEKEIWYRPNENSNAVGNLILHLCGNVRQWLIAGLGEAVDTRERQREFDEQGPLPTVQLLQQVEELAKDIAATLPNISEEQLVAIHAVQGYQETGVSILVHVVEHFSYHVGQVTYITKALKNKDMGYYAGHQLDVTS